MRAADHQLDPAALRRDVREGRAGKYKNTADGTTELRVPRRRASIEGPRDREAHHLQDAPPREPPWSSSSPRSLNGVTYGLLLFMLSSGLTLIFSMMGVLNFAHASFYMLGAYFALQS